VARAQCEGDSSRPFESSSRAAACEGEDQLVDQESTHVRKALETAISRLEDQVAGLRAVFGEMREELLALRDCPSSGPSRRNVCEGGFPLTLWMRSINPRRIDGGARLPHDVMNHGEGEERLDESASSTMSPQMIPLGSPWWPMPWRGLAMSW
jgi:hypothetical protein